ncbi:hypothetical protein ElyMa_002632200, partial [Elysia marginata]
MGMRQKPEEVNEKTNDLHYRRGGNRVKRTNAKTDRNRPMAKTDNVEKEKERIFDKRKSKLKICDIGPAAKRSSSKLAFGKVHRYTLSPAQSTKEALNKDSRN